MLPAESLVVDSESSKVSFGPFTFDRPNGLLREGSREIRLPPRVLGVLDVLISRPTGVVSKQELIDTVWKDAFVTDTSLAEAVSVLRQALRDDPQAPQYIQTVHRRGYRFVAPVSPLSGAPVSSEAAKTTAAGIDRLPVSIGRQLVPWTVACFSLMLAVITVWQYTHLGGPEPPVIRLRVDPASGTAFDRRAPPLALSPDGHLLAWSACDSTCRLYIRPLDQLDGRAIAGTDDASAPFFSPDGRWIGFFAAGKLRKVAIAGGMPVAITDAAQPFGAVWLANGRIVFAASRYGGLMQVSDAGGRAEELTLPNVAAGEVRHCWPSIAPGDRALLFTIAISPNDEAPGRIGLIPFGQRTGWQTIIDNADRAQTVSPDYIAFSRGNEIHAAPFDRARQALAGSDQALIASVARGEFTVSRSGAVAYSLEADTTRPSLAWSPAGIAVADDLAALHDLALTADGSRVAGVSGSDIWVGDLSRGTTTRLTHGGTNVSPVWRGDGAAVYYAATNGAAFDVWMRDSSATSPSRQVLSASDRHHHVFPTSVARNGQLMAYTESGGLTRSDVKVVNVASGASVATIETPFDETNGVLSPDGRLLAYQSDESGRWEIYIFKLDDRQRLAISSSGGQQPRWSPDGGTLFYSADGTMRVAIDSAGHPLGAPVAVPVPEGFVLAGVASSNRVLARRSGEVPSMHAALTLEWARDLPRLLGPPAATLPR